MICEPFAHAGHIITPFKNINGLLKYRVQEIGQTKERGQTLALDRAKELAEMFNPTRSELTPAGEQLVMGGFERNASPTTTQLDLF
tara:strand:- start:15537 stop:15794 length:258 start_codon:yes stop_codon:yes gene_type:complete